jgi:hypothetical protein
MPLREPESPRTAPRAARSAAARMVRTADAKRARLSSENVQILLSTTATAFAAALLAGQLLREARLHLSSGACGPVPLGFLAVGGAVGLWLPRNIARRGQGTPAPASSELAGAVFAAAALVAGLIAAPAGWVVARLERWRELMVTAFMLPQPMALVSVVAPLVAAAFLAGATAAVALAALHGWHRTAHRQRLHIAPLWVAWCSAAAAGCFVAFQLHDANRFWYVPALLLFAAAGIAVLRRSAHAPETTVTTTSVAPRQSFEPVGTAAVLGVTLATVLATPSSGDGRFDITVFMALGVAIGVVLLRVCVRLAVGAEFSPLAAVLASFLLLEGGLGAFSPLAAAALATTGVALLGRQAAREARSIQHSLATVGVAAASAFAAAAFVLAVASSTLGARFALLIVTVPACGFLGLLLILNRKRGRAARAACLSALALWFVAALAAVGGASRDTRPPAVHVHPLRAMVVPDEDVLALASAADVMGVDLAAPAVTTIVIAGSVAGEKSIDAPLADRVMRRLGRRLMPGGRVVLEQPLDEGVAAFVARYVRKTNPAFGPATALTVSRGTGGERDAYRAILIGRDVPAWIAGREWPAGYDATLCPLGPAMSAEPAADRGG